MEPNLNQLSNIEDFEKALILAQMPHESGYRSANFPAVFHWLQAKLDIQGAELIDPTPPGTIGGPAVIPPGPEDRKGKFEPEPGFYQGFEEVTSDKRWYFYWDMSSWSLHELGDLPQVPLNDGFGSFSITHSGAVKNDTILDRRTNKGIVNLVDISKFQDGFYYDTNGNLVVDSLYSAIKIPVKPGVLYTMNYAQALVWFNESGTKISHVSSPNSATGFTSPAGAVECRTATSTNNKRFFMFQEYDGTNRFTKEANEVGLEGFVDKNKVSGLFLKDMINLTTGAKLLNGTKKVTGAYYNSLPVGRIEAVSGRDILWGIILKKNTIYKIAGLTSVAQAVFYGFNYEIISTFTGIRTILVTPDEFYSLAISDTTAAIASLTIEEVEEGNILSTTGGSSDSDLDVTTGLTVTSSGRYTTQYFPVDPTKDYYYKRLNNFKIAFYDKAGAFISAISYGSFSNNRKDTFRPPINAKSMRFAGLQTQYTTNILSKIVYPDVYNLTKITVTMNSENWLSIRSACESAYLLADYKNRFIVYVPNGEYNETDFMGWGKYVKLIGESREGVVITSDGNSTNPDHVTPSNYVWPDEAGKQVSSINKIYKHLFFGYRDSHIENLTLLAIGCKYVSHEDSSIYHKLYFKNVRFVADDCQNVLGVGLWAGQYLLKENCVYENLTNQAILYIHNTASQSEGADYILKGGKMIGGCMAVQAEELGSGQVDNIVLDGVVTPNNKIISLSAANSSVPYNLNIMVQGGSQISTVNYTNRPNGSKTVVY